MEIKVDDRIFEAIEKGLGEGPLTLRIFCTKCNTQFELNKEAVAMAVMLNTSFVEYLRYVQSSSCKVCDKDNETFNKKNT